MIKKIKESFLFSNNLSSNTKVINVDKLLTTKNKPSHFNSISNDIVKL
jgi:hypothetical protein